MSASQKYAHAWRSWPGLLGAGAALIALGAAGCKGETTERQQPLACGKPQGSSTAVQTLAAAETAFGVALYSPATAAVGASQNVIVSPYSVSTTLTMVDVGAAGATAAQLQSVLRLPDTAANLAPAYAALTCEDQIDGSSGGNQLWIANSLWGQQGKAFQPTFLSVLSDGFGSPLQQVDFHGNPSAAAGAINQWVSSETNGQIPALLQSGDLMSSTALVLVDAVYFRGVWDTGFDPKNTANRSFTLSDGSTVSVPTMSGTINLGLGSGVGAIHGLSVYELPYKGGALVMDFFVPDGPLANFEASLTSDDVNGALASVGSPSQTNLDLPKFSFTTRLVLNPVLAGVGLTDAFDPSKADFSGIDGTRDLYVTAVVHEASIQVDENGTVATAAISATGGAFDIQQPLDVVIDHPFLFLIRNTKNGSILFMGRVLDPRQG